ncbi:hypothetical protein NOGI109294_07220 [Nocardiopsis gilva]|nr:hypothetical protein [Nocardiopsis gilva]
MRDYPAGHGPRRRYGVGYQAVWAKAWAERRTGRPKRARLAGHGLLRTVVLARLADRWSAGPASGRADRA